MKIKKDRIRIECEKGRVRFPLAKYDNWLGRNERDWTKWDLRIASDSASGKLDSLINEAKKAKTEGTLKDF